MNYAEEIAYWYLRLNGFFPLMNYVYHRLPSENSNAIYNADADILALRSPSYVETIFSGDREQILNSDDWINDFNGKWLGVICEVKGSKRATHDQVRNAFSRERMSVAIRRLGLFPDGETGDIVEEFQSMRQFPNIDNSPVTIMKLLFSAINEQNRHTMESNLWKTLTLAEADEFIRNRINDFPDVKSGGRYFFPSTLFQYIVWSERPEHYE